MRTVSPNNRNLLHARNVIRRNKWCMPLICSCFVLPRTIQMTYCIYLITNFNEYTLCGKQNPSCNWLANGICILCKLALRYTTIFDAFSTNSDNRRAVLSFREKNNAHRAEKFITCEFSLYLKTGVLFHILVAME